jgi:DNA-binding MarR family transcriptional regulator
MDTKQSASVHAAIACLQRLTEVFQQRRLQLAQSVGLSDQQWAVLEQVSTEHFMPSMFARMRDSSPAAVSKILRQLVDKGLVLARIDTTDARQRRYELTAQGKKAMTTLRRNRERAIDAIWTPIPDKELDAFTRFGTRLTESLEKYAASATD